MFFVMMNFIFWCLLSVVVYCDGDVCYECINYGRDKRIIGILDIEYDFCMSVGGYI